MFFLLKINGIDCDSDHGFPLCHRRGVKYKDFILTWNKLTLLLYC